MDAKVLPGPGVDIRNSQNDKKARHSIQSVDRALLLLETIAEMGGEATLITRNFVTKVPGRRLYALGGRILYIGHVCLQVDLPRRAQSYLESVNESTGETVHLAALQGDVIANLSVREARHAVRVETGRLGKIPAPHAQSIGKAILAWLPDDEVRRIVGTGLKRYTANTIGDFPALLESLSGVRRIGYAIDHEEYLPGVICIGAAIRDHTGGIVGSISASTPTMRANDKHLALMREQVLEAARAMSTEFGYAASQNQFERASVAAG
jgi:IclR family acetate operon transcriptional repressor